MKYSRIYGEELERILRKIAKNPKLFHDFLTDLFSPAEYQEFAIRWQIAKLLNTGETHRDISTALRVGVATINRGSKELKKRKGGFQAVLLKHSFSRNTKKRS